MNSNDAKSLASSEVSGSALSSNSESSTSSFDSNNSHGSFGRFYVNKPPQRRHRRRTKATSLLRKRPAEKNEEARRYQCTFRTDKFRTKHDWTRHERTLHPSLEKFTCSPYGPTYNDPSTGMKKCAFCDESNPSERHAELHRVSVCQQKPAAFRNFYRKDHLI